MKCSILWYIFYEIIFTNAHSYNHAREHRRKKEDNKQETSFGNECPGHRTACMASIQLQKDSNNLTQGLHGHM